MYWGQSWGTGGGLSHRMFLAEVNHSHERHPPSAGSNPPLSMCFEGAAEGHFCGEKTEWWITRVQAPNLVLSYRVDASSPGSCVTSQDAANSMTHPFEAFDMWLCQVTPMPSTIMKLHWQWLWKQFAAISSAAIFSCAITETARISLNCKNVAHWMSLIWTAYENHLTFILKRRFADSPQRFLVWKTFGCGSKLSERDSLHLGHVVEYTKMPATLFLGGDTNPDT